MYRQQDMDRTIDTAIQGFTVRLAREDDIGPILGFIRRLAELEGFGKDFSATDAALHDALFVKKQAEAIVGELDGKPVALALFFQGFSGFLGRPSLYLEDLFVDGEHRRRGLGREMLARLAAIAKERGCPRIDWLCMEWNEKAIEFYGGLGAVPMPDMIVYRLKEPRLGDLSRRS